MKKIIFIVVFQFLLYPIFAQIPAGYYEGTEGLTGGPLKEKLHNIIKNHTVTDYSNMDFSSIDKKPDGTVWDIYSDIPGGTPPYQYNFSQNTGNYNSEGDCWNKEHSFPQSWFNGKSPMVSDYFHIYPTDGYVNNRRGNYAYGKVAGNGSWTSQNGSKVGSNSTSGFSGTVFEPIDAYKGDLARTYFYMSVRYYTEDTGWSGSDMANGANLKAWAYALLQHWDTTDAVSQKEIDRNNEIYKIQRNRNPFIDHPEFVKLIGTAFSGANDIKESLGVNIYPNPVMDILTLNIDNNFRGRVEIKIIDIIGKTIYQTNEVKSENNFNRNLDLEHFSNGVYYLQINTSAANRTLKIVKQ